MRAGDLLANPLNFRIHPKEQRAALRGSLDVVGWLKDVIVNTTTGHVLDGHARVEDALGRSEDEPVPVTFVELSLEEERLALAVLDPITEMAVRDDEQVACGSSRASPRTTKGSARSSHRCARTPAWNRPSPPSRRRRNPSPPLIFNPSRSRAAVTLSASAGTC